MVQRDQIPIINVSGTARECGRAHGEQLRESIAHGLDLWFERLAATGSAPGTTISEFLSSTGHLRAARQWTPAAVDEIRGIAEGARVDFESIFAYNLADQQEVFLKAQPDRCTAIGIRTGSGGVPISGQTMDTPGWFEETKVVLSTHRHGDSHDVLSFTVAGIVTLCGVNSAGIAVWCNAVYQLTPSPLGVPVACIARTVLNQTTLDAATDFVRMVPHASGQNYVVGAPQGLASLECSSKAVAEVRANGNAVWHTNHPVANEDRVNQHDGRDSLRRDAFAREQLREAVNRSDLELILSDRTTPICKIAPDADEFSHTLWAVIVEHTTPPRIQATPGPPYEADWQQLTFHSTLEHT